MNKKIGFSLIELMIVIAIIAVLTMIAVPNFTRFLAKSKRTEAYMNLNSIYAAQKTYWAQHGRYASQLSGPGGLGWKPEGYKGGGADENFYYTYGFSNGSEGTAYVTGKLNSPSSDLSAAHADNNSFLVVAAGDIDGDGISDILTVDQYNNIVVIQDDLAD